MVTRNEHNRTLPTGQELHGHDAAGIWRRLAASFFGIADYTTADRDRLWNRPDLQLPTPLVGERGVLEAEVVRRAIDGANASAFLLRHTGDFRAFASSIDAFLDYLANRAEHEDDDWYLVPADWSQCIALTYERWDGRPQLWILQPISHAG